ncbi:hypothetical protein IGB42_00059 [Andreprevotia sp. IGB-42]|uniref:thiol-disulfide oxidoreductase DCC family protein n=1 Tax=Andreprevotia sp. IGB-42 TaxID=2497473 RepID=UPI0013587BC4|nr:DUF393 domain-containing protein [Andreprevotia sp. IGB-42]KAF0814983.1 hypothetical protein IGB42_00059 [Andreprevotia sp. IGB-42]
MLTIYFDATCPLCRREIALLKKLDHRQRLACIDINAAAFNVAPLGTTVARLKATLHVQPANGAMIIGADAVRTIYRTIGLGWLVFISELPGLRQLFNAGYARFANRRSDCTAGVCNLRRE